MSRIGKRKIVLPQGVTLSNMEGRVVEVSGPKGKLSCKLNGDINVSVLEGEVVVERGNESKENKAYHGLFNALITNMIVGVSEGYKKSLELIGVGYKASNQGNLLEMSLGYSHTIFFSLPEEVQVATQTAKGKNPIIEISGIDKQLVGQIAAKIRSLRKPEPYKGKGVRYVGEVVRRKAGKTAASK